MNRKYILLAVLAMAAVVGAVAWSLIRNQPEEVVSRMMARMSRVKSAHFKAEIQAGGAAVFLAPGFGGILPVGGAAGTAAQDSRLSASLEGDLDLSDPAFPLFQTLVAYSRSGGAAGAFRFDGEIRARDKKIYILRQPASENRWAVGGGDAPQAKPPGAGKAAAEEAAVSREKAGRIRELLAQAKFFTMVRELKATKIGTVPVFHYQVKVSRPELRSFLVDSAATVENRDPSAEEVRDIDRQLDALGEMGGELWIGRGDGLLYRALLGASPEGGSWKLDVTSSRHDQPVAVEAPENALPFGESFRLLPGALPSSGEREATTTAGGEQPPTGGAALIVPGEGVADRDSDGLSDELEAFYGTDPANPDTDGDGMNDGEEVNAGRNPRGEGGLFDFGIGR